MPCSLIRSGNVFGVRIRFLVKISVYILFYRGDRLIHGIPTNDAGVAGFHFTVRFYIDGIVFIAIVVGRFGNGRIRAVDYFDRILGNVLNDRFTVFGNVVEVRVGFAFKTCVNVVFNTFNRRVHGVTGYQTFIAFGYFTVAEFFLPCIFIGTGNVSSIRVGFLFKTGIYILFYRGDRLIHGIPTNDAGVAGFHFTVCGYINGIVHVAVIIRGSFNGSVFAVNDFDASFSKVFNDGFAVFGNVVEVRVRFVFDSVINRTAVYQTFIAFGYFAITEFFLPCGLVRTSNIDSVCVRFLIQYTL